MLHQVSEKTMHRVRWVLVVGWLLLIASLFYDPITVAWTQPNNWSSPFRVDSDLAPELKPRLLRIKKSKSPSAPLQNRLIEIGARSEVGLAPTSSGKFS